MLHRQAWRWLAAIGLWTALALAGCGRPSTQIKSDPNAIARGEKVDLTDYIVEGQYTVFDFYSDYCPPCRKLSPVLERLDEDRDDITVVKVDINRPGRSGIDWGSPVARQYKLEAIPHLKIFDKNGRLAWEGRAAMEQIQKWLDE